MLKSLTVAACVAAAAAAAAPNIIWLQTDSMDGRLLDPTSSYYEKVFMRGLKQVAANGVTFARHYTNSPQCVPSRTSMVTGRYVHETGTTNNGQGIARSPVTGQLDKNCVSQWDQDTCNSFATAQNVTVTFLDGMAAAGYDLHLFGRFDIGAGILQDYPGTSGDGFHGGPSLGILTRGANIEGATKPNPFATTDDHDDDPYGGDAAVAAQVSAFFSSHNPLNGSAPWMVWAGLIAPHPPYDTNATWLTHVNMSAVDVPPQPDPASMHPYDRFMSVSKGCWDQNFTDAEIMTMRSTYWGACGEGVELLMSIVAAAEAHGHLNNTIVIYTSDHGEMSVEHWQDYKNSLYEPSTRVPLIMTGYNVTAAGSGAPMAAGAVITNLTSHIDIFPTLLDLAGAPIPSFARGQSLKPFLFPDAAAPAAPRKDYVALQYHSNMGNTGSFGLVAHPSGGGGDRYKLITFGHTLPWFNASSYVPMLFNVDQDPYELNNLAPQQPALVAAMTAMLEAEFGGTGSLQRIDAAQMASDLALYNTFYYERCNSTQLPQRFLDAFKGATAAQVEEQVTAWSGRSPSTATGNGTNCPNNG